MAASTLQNLLSNGNLADLVAKLKDVPSFYNEGAAAAPGIQELLRREFKDNPELGNINLVTTPSPKMPGGFMPGSNTMALGVLNPAVVGHELGHAKNLQNSKVYSPLLRISKQLSNMNSRVALPTMLAIRMLVKNQADRNEALNFLTGVSAMLAAPGLTEELSASIDAMRNAPDKLQAVKTLLPAFLQHTIHSAMPVGIYQGGKYL